MKTKDNDWKKQEINKRKQKQEDKVMKTNFKTETGIKVQKSISKSLAIVTSIALISITLNAQDLNYSLFEKISFNENPLAMIHTPAKTSVELVDLSAFAALAESETEEALQLEDWMMNENNFTTGALVETESESSMELESWMTNESLFDIHSAYMKVETEEALKLESWMLNENLFTTELNVDQPLELENWMISEVIWK